MLSHPSSVEVTQDCVFVRQRTELCTVAFETVGIHNLNIIFQRAHYVGQTVAFPVENGNRVVRETRHVTGFRASGPEHAAGA